MPTEICIAVRSRRTILHEWVLTLRRLCRPRAQQDHEGPDQPLKTDAGLPRPVRLSFVPCISLADFVPLSYTPGFDTHGLPLELKALSTLSAPHSSLTPFQIRAAARAEAEKGIEIQKQEFRSFAVIGDWEKPYRTMDWEFERRQLRVVRDMVRRGASEHALMHSAPARESVLRDCALCRPHCDPPPPDALLPLFSHRPRRSRTRVPRRPHFAIGLRLVPDQGGRRQAGTGIGEVGSELERGGTAGTVSGCLDDDGVDGAE